MFGKDKIELGKKGRDKVTGLEGILTGYAKYLFGCDQYCILPESTDNKPSEGVWIDDGRVEVIGDGIKPKDVQGKKDGGPQFCPNRS
jgi:hypothetical protein